MNFISNGNEISTDSSTDVPSKDSNTNVGTDSGSDSGNEDGSEECTNHVLKKVYGTPASCTEEGTKTHYVCDVCGKLFLDENGEKRRLKFLKLMNGILQLMTGAEQK